MDPYINRYVKFEGDGPTCGRYLGIAKKWGEQLFNQHKDAKGMGTITKQYPLTDAVVRIDVDPRTINIFIKAVVEDGVEIISGMVNAGYLTNVNVDGKTVSALFQFEPSSIQAAIEKRGRDFRPEPSLAVLPTDENNRISSEIHTFAQAGNIAPSMYTGKMTQAAQLAMGLKGKQVFYQHSFYCTHGIFMDGNTPWLVEISLNNGVIAKKLTGSKRAKQKVLDDAIKLQFPMIPDGIAFPVNIPKAIAAGSVIRLMEPGELTDYYGNSPYFFDCGWAFNDSGNEAVNTCWSWPDDWKRGKMFKINFTGGGGAGPSGAFITKVKEEYIYNPDYFHGVSNSRFYIPAGGDDIQTFPMTRAGFVQAKPPGLGSSWETPIYAFYIGNKIQVYSHKCYGNVEPALTGGWDSVDPRSLLYTRNDASAWPPGTPLIAEYYNKNYNYIRPHDQVDVIDFAGPGIGSVEAVISNVYEKVKFDYTPTNLGGAIFYDYVNIQYYHTVGQASYTQENGLTAGKSVSHSLVISPKNRSSVFIGTNTTETSKHGSSRVGQMGLLVTDGSSVDRYTASGLIAESLTLTTTPNIGALCQAAGDFYVSGASPEPTILFATGRFELDFLNHVLIGSGTIVPNIDQFTPDPGSVLTRSMDFKSRNYGGEYSLRFDPNVDSAGYVLAFRTYQPSPDDFGSYIQVASGRSAFLGSQYASKNVQSITGPNFKLTPADGENMANISSYVSWVGYE